MVDWYLIFIPGNTQRHPIDLKVKKTVDKRKKIGSIKQTGKLPIVFHNQNEILHKCTEYISSSLSA